MTSPETTTDEATLRTPLSADVAGLRGVHGTMLLRVDGEPVGALLVEDRKAKFLPTAREGSAIADFDDASDIREMLSGRLNPVVANLQRRVNLQGDTLLAARIILGMRTGAAFKPLVFHDGGGRA